MLTTLCLFIVGLSPWIKPCGRELEEEHGNEVRGPGSEEAGSDGEKENRRSSVSSNSEQILEPGRVRILTLPLRPVHIVQYLPVGVYTGDNSSRGVKTKGVNIWKVLRTVNST